MVEMRKPYILLLVFAVSSCAVSQPPAILLNQLGFYPNAPKQAIITGSKSDAFYIINNLKGDTVLKGRSGSSKPSLNSSLVCRLADFSSLNKEGQYKMLVPGIESSPVFSIRAHIHEPLVIASLKGYYYQRVSMPLEEKYAGTWARPAGHPDTAVLIHPSAATAQRPAGTIISTPGGWYDAGDYNKYIVNSGITMGTLLSAYEDFTEYFDTLKTNIPESDDKIPDILNEIIYNLRWMLSMQDPFDGGVYNKCTNASFDGMVMPGVTKAPRYVVQKGTAATLDFAAVTAQASRILVRFEKELPGLSDSCLKAAASAWQWAVKNPAIEYNQDAMNKKFQPAVTTGGYGDQSFLDEWYWAAVELYATTGKSVYAEHVKKYSGPAKDTPSWPNVGMMGDFTLLRFEKKVPLVKEPNLQLHDKVVKMADGMINLSNRNAFATVIGGRRADFIWGSNAVAANQGWLLVNAFFITGKKTYLDHALANLDYLLGRNATGYCFVTGIGSKSTMHPHHRPSVADGIVPPVPGLLAGGPNAQANQQDKCAYVFKEPETMYVDNDCSYASNEIAINWNAPLVYLSAAMEVFYRKK